MTARTIRLLVPIAWLLHGCTPVPYSWGFSVGQPLAPLTKCVLDIEGIPLAEAERLYQRVGEVCLGFSGVKSTNEIVENSAALDLLMQRACTLGGDIVVAGGVCAFPTAAYYDVGPFPAAMPHDEGGIAYHVFRKRPGTP